MSQGLKKLEKTLQTILAQAHQKDWDQLLPHPAWWESWEEQLLTRWRSEKERKTLEHQEKTTNLHTYERLNCGKF